MSLKIQSLGTISGSATSGISITSTTNATPIVATFGAGHGLKSGDRIHISGITGNTKANGEWELEFIAANQARLVGSKGNGTHGGTPVVSVVCKKSPFFQRHRATAVVTGNISAGTIDVEGHDGTESSPGVLDPTKWVKASITDQHPSCPPFGTGNTYTGSTPPATAGATFEVVLFPYMRVAAKTALTGSGQVILQA